MQSLLFCPLRREFYPNRYPNPIQRVPTIASITSAACARCSRYWLGLALARSKLFYRLNLLVCTPLCLVLFVASLVVASA